MSRGKQVTVAALVIVGALGAIYWYTAAQTSLQDATVIVGVLGLLSGVCVGGLVAAGALTRRFPWLGRPIVLPMWPRVHRKWRILGSVAVVAVLVLVIYDPPRDYQPTDTFGALGASIAWGMHDLMGLAPHDRHTWEGRRKKLETELANERAKAPETIYALVSHGRDLESARFLTAMRLRQLEREVSVARDSAAAYDECARDIQSILSQP